MTETGPVDSRDAGTGRDIAAEPTGSDDGLGDWTVRPNGLTARFRLPAYAVGVTFVDQIAAEAERVDHHPTLTLAYDFVEVHLTSHDVGHRTQRDTDLARNVSSLAAALGLLVDPSTGETGND